MSFPRETPGLDGRMYIVVVSGDIGGAERRFFDIFTAIKREGYDINFVAPCRLIRKLQSDHPMREDVFCGMIGLGSEQWSSLKFVTQFVIFALALKRGTFHYPLNCIWPFHRLRGDRVTASVTDCTHIPRLAFSRKNILSYLKIIGADKIDVLSPWVYKKMKYLGWGENIQNTPMGTYVLLDNFPECDLEAPQTVCLFGRMEKGKGFIRFLDILQDVWRALSSKVSDSFRFSLCGYGSLAEIVNRKAEKLRGAGVPIYFDGLTKSYDVYAASSVMLSLQTPTNYPSRIIAEALLSGRPVVVSDSGDSRNFGDIPGLFFTKSPINPCRIAHDINAALAVANSQSERVRISESAQSVFSSNKYLEYYKHRVFHLR